MALGLPACDILKKPVHQGFILHLLPPLRTSKCSSSLYSGKPVPRWNPPGDRSQEDTAGTQVTGAKVINGSDEGRASLFAAAPELGAEGTGAALVLAGGTADTGVASANASDSDFAAAARRGAATGQLGAPRSAPAAGALWYTTETAFPAALVLDRHTLTVAEAGDALSTETTASVGRPAATAIATFLALPCLQFGRATGFLALPVVLAAAGGVRLLLAVNTTGTTGAPTQVNGITGQPKVRAGQSARPADGFAISCCCGALVGGNTARAASHAFGQRLFVRPTAGVASPIHKSALSCLGA